jgi:hypothetical protein
MKGFFSDRFVVVFWVKKRHFIILSYQPVLILLIVLLKNGNNFQLRKISS